MILLHFALFYCGFLIISIDFEKCSVCQKVKKPLRFIAFLDFKTEKEHPAAPRDRWEREILEKF